jgi:hypothetical protein
MNAVEYNDFRQFTRITIGNRFAKAVVRIEEGNRTIEFLANQIAYRKLATWGYRMAVEDKQIRPINEDINKRAYWEEAKKWDLPHEEQIELAKAIYYLSQK